LCCVTFSGIIAHEDATAAGAEAYYMPQPKKSVEKKRVRISTKPDFLIINIKRSRELSTPFTHPSTLQLSKDQFRNYPVRGGGSQQRG
jgi:ubiquitin C-terminal hydrolase